MAPGAWTRDDLCALAAGRTVRVSGPTGHDHPVPYWLGCAAGEVAGSSVAERVAARFPGDQRRYTDAWRAALAAPGELVEVEYRARAGGRDDPGGWRRERASIVNLLDRDDVRGIVVATEDLGPDEVPSLDGGADGERGAGPTDWALFWLDDRARVTAAEGAVLAVFGVTAEELVGRSPIELLHPDGIGELVERWVEVTEAPGSVRTARQRVVLPDDTLQPVELTVVHRVREDGTSEYPGIAHDLSARATAEDAVADAEHRAARLAESCALMADGLDVALFRCDAAGMVLSGDDRWNTLVATVNTQPSGCILDVADADGSRLLADALRGLTASVVGTVTRSADVGRPVTVEVGAADGATVLSFLLRAVTGSDGAAVVGAASDVTAEVRGRRRTRHDTVTGLLNRRTLEARLADALVHDRSGTLVVYLDLDRFGEVNEAYGPDAGDEVLEAVADRLRQAVRPGDEVCRYGGDEFVILCHDAADGAAVAVHRRIEAVLAAPVACGGGWWAPSASIGIARPTATEDLAEVIRRAGRIAADEKRRDRTS